MIRLLAKTFSLKVIQAVIFSIKTYKKYMIVVGNEKINKNKDIWNYCHRIPMLPLLGDNHLLPLLHMPKHFIWFEEAKKLINKFDIVYMTNPSLNVNKSFRYQVEKCMITTFGELTQSFNKSTLSR